MDESTTAQCCSMFVMGHSAHTLLHADDPKRSTRTLSDNNDIDEEHDDEEEELSMSSAASSVRDVMASCRATRENLRKSRASLRVLLEESRQTIEDARQLRNALCLMINRDKTYCLEEESDHVSDAGSEPSATHSELSDLTPDHDDA